jgi:cysteinyl-tRNA synthetase
MSKAILGETIDLHTGGVDLLFPHHENEIAQSECCNGKQFSKHWYHSEHLLVDGKKMSKSLGNLYTLDQLKEMGHSPMALRYALLMGHPRKQLNFTLDSLHAAESNLDDLRNLVAEIRVAAELPIPPEGQLTGFDNLNPDLTTFGSFEPAIEALRGEFNVPEALGVIFSVRKEKYRFSLTKPQATASETSAAKADYLGLRNLLWALGVNVQRPTVEAPTEIKSLAAKRWAAKQAKDFAAADALRKELTAAGWSMLDSKTDYKLEPVKK